jgi:hydrogenase expression/formation protein HypD
MEPRAIDGWSSPAAVAAIAGAVAGIRIDRPVTLMHVCGTHEHAIARAGIRALLPAGVRLIAGPGCPVCVCPARDIDLAIEASEREGTILATFGDMMRVPATAGSLERARAGGADVRVVYSPSDAIDLAREDPGRTVIFMAVGFETTAAPIAAAIAADPPENFLVIASLRLIPPALRFLLDRGTGTIDGFVLPGHASVVIGRSGYRFLETEYRVPSVIAGFEPVDILQGLHALLTRIAAGERGAVMNEYRRVVHENGNPKAREAIDRCFAPGESAWRGIGVIPDSGLSLRGPYVRLDAVRTLGLESRREAVDVQPGCQCHRVMLGEVEPEECALFGGVCTPRTPFGPCMVSSEGTCRARFAYRRIEG